MKSSECINILFHGTPADRSYLHYLKPLVGKHKCFVHTNPINTLYEIESYCRERNITAVITTSPTLLKKLSGRDNPKIDNFAGSYFSRSGVELRNCRSTGTVCDSALRQVHVGALCF